MHATIRDVANAAGVSPMAVSKVLHGRGKNVRVGEDTAALIRRVAEELRYEPNALARSFRSRRTKTIGLIFDNWSRIAGGSQYMALLLDAITMTAFPRGYAMTICPQLTEGPEAINDGRFDGLLWAKFESSSENLRALERSRTPMVLLHASHSGIVERGFDTYCCENSQAMRLAVDHLADLGHRRIAFVAPLETEHNDETQARIEGVRTAMASRELPFDEPDILNWDYDAAAFEAWWKSNPPHTALILRSESQAGAIYERAAHMGVHLPKDLSIVGFDSTSHCEALSPRLTAIRQPVDEMVGMATQRLLALIEEGRTEPPAVHSFACGLDVRESTTPPRK